MKKVFKWIGIICLIPVILFILTAILLYIPSFQNYAAHEAAKYASEEYHMNISLQNIHLAFPLKLKAEGVEAVQGKDTVLSVQEIKVSIQFLPLLHKNIVLDGAELSQAKVNTLDLIEGIHVKGYMNNFYADSRGINLDPELAQISNIRLKNADLSICLADTTQKQEDSIPNKWKIRLQNVDIANSQVRLYMPLDSIDLAAYIGKGSLRRGYLDLHKEIYSIQKVTLDNSSFSYNLNDKKALESGFDYEHISLSNIHADLDSIYYQGTNLRTSIHELSLQERCGLTINNLQGKIDSDAKRIIIPHLNLTTPDSYIETDAHIEWDALNMGKNGQMSANLLAQIGKTDIMHILGNEPAEFIQKYPNQPLALRIALRGNMDRLRLNGVQMRLPSAFSIKADGEITAVTDSIKRCGSIRYQSETEDVNFLLALAGPDIMKTYVIPTGLTLTGESRFHGTLYETSNQLNVNKGQIDFKGLYNTNGDRYEADTKIQNIQLHDFMPKDSLYQLTADCHVQGNGLNIYSPTTSLEANADITDFGYGSINLKGISCQVKTQKNQTEATLTAQNDLFAGEAKLKASIRHRWLEAMTDIKLTKADWHAMHLTEKPLRTAGNLTMDLKTDLDRGYHINAKLQNLAMITKRDTYHPKDLELKAFTQKDSTDAYVKAGDLELMFKAEHDLWTIMEQSIRFSSELMAEYEEKNIDQNKLKQYLPTLCIKAQSGPNNPIANWIKMNGVSFQSFNMDMDSSPEEGINGYAHLYKLKADSLTLDTIRFDIRQDTAGIKYYGQVRNAPNNKQFVFDAKIDGEIYHKGATLKAVYYNEKHEKGLDMGLRCEIFDDGLGFFITPDNPLIIWRQFKVNEDQYVFIHKSGKIYANLNLLDKDGVGIKLHTDNIQGSTPELKADLCKIDLNELTNMLPYVPRISGVMDAEIKYIEGQQTTTLRGNVAIKDLFYENSPLGDMEMNVLYLPTEEQKHIVNMEILKDKREIGQISGTYTNDLTSNIEGTILLEHFPFDLCNGFIPDHLFGFSGYAEGELNVQGSLDRPVVNGVLQLDSVKMYSDIYGVRFRFTNDPVHITNSNLLFDQFKVYAIGQEPFVVNGNINFANLDKVQLNLRMNAENYQLLDAKRKLNSILFGQVFADFNSTLRGTLDDLVMKGNLNILGNTNVTYVMKDTPLTVEDRLSDLVTFVNFNDTTSIQREEEKKPYTFMGLNMTMSIRIEESAQVAVELSSDRQSYINLEGGGRLTFRYNPQGDMSLIGRYTLISGEMRYQLPVIPLKTFTLTSGSYVEFTGNPWNPTLNISAKERIRSSVTENDQPRTVAFDVGVDITNTFKKMGLAFTLEAPEDATIQNQLASMTETERGKLAVTMLATGMYLAEGNSSRFSVNNALNSFLQSEISNIAGNALKTVDISVGMEDNTNASGVTSTDYSFRFSKRLWGNKVRVVIGGKVSSGNDANSQGQSFIDDVSLEYRLDESGTRYVRLFHDKNYDSMLDGEITETGGGVVLRKKINKFSELFLFRRKKKDKSVPVENDLINKNKIKKP